MKNNWSVNLIIMDHMDHGVLNQIIVIFLSINLDINFNKLLMGNKIIKVSSSASLFGDAE